MKVCIPLRGTVQRAEIGVAAENDWQFPQEIPNTLRKPTLSIKQQYGFLDMHSGYFKHVAYAENEVNELSADAENCSPAERRKRRIKHEDEKWDEEYYM